MSRDRIRPPTRTPDESGGTGPHRQQEELPESAPWMLWLGVGLVLVFLAVAAVGGYRDLATQRRQETRLEAEIERTEERIELLEERIEALKTDPVALERRAREELGYVRPDDVVFVFVEDAADGSPPESEVPEPPG